MRYKKVLIEWVDSSSIRGWRHDSEMTDSFAEPAKIQSIGYLLKDTKDFVTITTSVSENGGIMDPLSIPKVAITKRKTFR